MNIRYLLLCTAVYLAACSHTVPPADTALLLGRNADGTAEYLLPERTVHGRHPLFSFAVVETRYPQPWISSMFVNKKDGMPADKYVSYRQTWYAVDCRTAVWQYVGSTDYHADGHVVESLNEYSDYPPLDYQMLRQLAGTGGSVYEQYYQHMSEEQKRNLTDPGHPVVRAVCGKTAWHQENHIDTPYLYCHADGFDGVVDCAATT